MSGFIFKAIEIKNFKYISNEDPVKVDFKDGNIIILDGPNGYGKTTLFDAIELLLSGNIRHFNPGLPNRKNDNIGILANNSLKDIKITGIISINNQDVILERIFFANDFTQSVIYWDQKEISQNELFKKLNFSLSLFELGTYISQSQSLDFLQNKYKARKDQVSGLLQEQNIVEKINLLKIVRDGFYIRIDEKISEITEAEKSARNTVEKLSVDIKNINVNPVNTYFRLFPDQEYEFDKEYISIQYPYEQFIQPLINLEIFIKNYGEFKKYINNSEINSLLEMPVQMIMAYYYSEEIKTIKANHSILNLLRQCKKLLIQFNSGNFIIEENHPIFQYLNINTKETLFNLYRYRKSAQNSISQMQNAIVKLNEARNNLIRQFKQSVSANQIRNDICPLCGSELQNSEEAFSKTEQNLFSAHDSVVKQLSELQKGIENICNEEIAPLINRLLAENNQLLILSENLSQFINYDIEELSRLLNKFDIKNFSSDHTVFNLEIFNRDYGELKKHLSAKIAPLAIVLTPEHIEMFKSIHFQYYKNGKPLHTSDQIQHKKHYIAFQYLNALNKKHNEALEKLNLIIKSKTNFNLKVDAIKSLFNKLISKYDSAYKDYQSLLANAIRLPLLIYSGRIIQNYPMGLGINAVIKTNQIVFEAATKSEVDVYNILSTGQLNGLAIAILLAVRNVYSKENGIDLLMIDDPLQTIDDISSISLADLLTQQKIGQIILSTHEDQKARLLGYKFKQADLKVTEINMQKIYLNATSAK